MTDHDRVTVSRNGTSVQVYFKKTFAADTAFPFDAGDEVLAYVTSVGVHLVPLRNVGEIVAEPLCVEPPPRAAVPPSHRPSSGDTDDGRTEHATNGTTAAGFDFDPDLALDDVDGTPPTHD